MLAVGELPGGGIESHESDTRKSVFPGVADGAEVASLPSVALL